MRALSPSHWANRLADNGILGGYSSVVAVLVSLNQAILVAWGLASWAFQRQLTRKRKTVVLQFGWRFVDVTALCLLIAFDDALMSPLTVAFAVLIVASAFSASSDPILQTTVLSMGGYILLVLMSYWLNNFVPRSPVPSLPLPGRPGFARPDAHAPGESHRSPRVICAARDRV